MSEKRNAEVKKEEKEKEEKEKEEKEKEEKEEKEKEQLEAMREKAELADVRIEKDKKEKQRHQNGFMSGEWRRRDETDGFGDSAGVVGGVGVNSTVWKKMNKKENDTKMLIALSKVQEQMISEQMVLFNEVLEKQQMEAVQPLAARKEGLFAIFLIFLLLVKELAELKLESERGGNGDLLCPSPNGRESCGAVSQGDSIAEGERRSQCLVMHHLYLLPLLQQS
ncbi:uncharacterized protein MONOS_8827 [Monocercomonoides exilis]|uniref:uncharacterized protein n=1 Tax=Monocercomonoides exilis TaxID=2049356 RepID=UPI0035596FE4|nr:hypothetical protein MONOS_8827 [Monocercomonoides exilis]|eukprot:MONOS_8827.1-p1 / transcript=MONOS_8827.1 / gene=MONOS_8827 / organism=Monocercomonoides_exilis_PA203 / gene_product=unspecified product / transcript_product=unspecified product / location=Mono_scaffold00344:16200-17102(+) / protein_length=223 / sequence_SO=supercontig / SO=protein_coding / is_pseudo=false